MSQTSVLIVEDEFDLADTLASYFRHAGYDASVLQHGDEVLPWLHRRRADALVLDVALPGLSGLELTRRIRAYSTVPILLATGQIDEERRIAGLLQGADDYVCKPYSPREVVARVAGILRRVARPPEAAVPLPSGWVLCESSFCVEAPGGRCVQLTEVEFRLVQVLHSAPSKVFSRAELMTRIYPDHRVVSERTVDSHIKKLRRKFALLGEMDGIESVYGFGYRLMPSLLDVA